MKFVKNIRSLGSLTVFAAVLVFGTSFSASAAIECNDRNIFGAKVDGRCVYFSKGDGPDVCTADNSSGYGVQTFSCPEEFLKAYDDKITAEQKKITEEQEEAERLADEELDKEIREAVEEQLKQQERVRNESVPTQSPVITEPLTSPQTTISPMPVEITTKTPPTPVPATSAPEDGFENMTIQEPALVPNTEEKTSLWAHFSGFLSRLNPFSWFK